MINNQKIINSNDSNERQEMEKKNKNSKPEKWVKEIMDVSASAVIGYEKYLLDQLNYTELARIMTKLRKVLEYNEHIFDDDKGDSKKQ